jgi:hypothetical protein
MAAMKYSTVRKPKERWLIDLILLFILSTAPFESCTQPVLLKLLTAPSPWSLVSETWRPAYCFERSYEPSS